MYKCCDMMSLLRDIKFVSHDRIFLLPDKSVDLTGVYHIKRHYLNVCDIIISAYDKVLRCDVTSLIYCFQTISKPDLLLFRTIAATGDLLSKHALGML